jgi:hypothetical protein
VRPSRQHDLSSSLPNSRYRGIFPKSLFGHSL